MKDLNLDDLTHERLILRLFASFPNLASTATAATRDAYVAAVSAFSVESVKRACERFATGDVEGVDRHYGPSAAELASMARMFQSIRDRQDAPAEHVISVPIGRPLPPGYVPLGPIEVDFGHGRIDMRKLDHKAKEFVLKHQRLPDPEERKQVGVQPRLQSMRS